MKPYSTTGQVLNQAIQQLAVQAGWTVTDPGTLIVQDITYTALQASGAPITIQYIPGGTAGAEVVTVSGNAITVKIQTGVSTATQVMAALAASAAAMLLVYAAITGTAGTAQVSITAPAIVQGDVVLRIIEADNEIDTRIAGMGIAMPFTVNPPVLQDMSVLYARYACLRDLYTGANPQANSESAQKFLDAFNAKWEQIRTGFQVLVDSSGAAIAAGKYGVQTAEYPATEGGGDKYPNFPNGPYPDLPGVDSY